MKDRDLLSALLKGVDTGSTGAMSSIDQSNKLAQLLKQNELKQQAIAQNQAAVDAQAKAQGLKPGQYSTSVGAEHYNITPKDNSMALANLFDRKTAREERERERLTSRAQQLGLPTAVTQLENLESTTANKENGEGGILTNPNYEPKSAGPIANFLPQWGRNLGEKVGLMPAGAAAERQAAQALMNTDTRKFAGANQSMHEMGRKLAEQGLSGLGDPSDFVRGMGMMRSAIQAEASTLESGFDKNIVGDVKSRGAVFNPADVGLGAIPQQINPNQPGPTNGMTVPVNMRSAQRSVVRQQRNKKTGQIRTIYSDGTVEVK